jgi:creatine kinase
VYRPSYKDLFVWKSFVGGRGEHSPPGPNGEFDISNKGRIGASEVKYIILYVSHWYQFDNLFVLQVELVQRMIDGVDKLIDLEEQA